MFALIALAVLAVIIIRNIMVKKRNYAREAWHGISIQLKRRYDLIPSLNTVVREYAKHESDVFEKIIALRSTVVRSATIGDSETQLQLSKELKSFLMTVENYPELKANANFMELQKELKEIEDYLQNSRRYYNATVREYNNFISFFPNNIFARLFKFKSKKFYGEDE